MGKRCLHEYIIFPGIYGKSPGFTPGALEKASSLLYNKGSLLANSLIKGKCISLKRWTCLFLLLMCLFLSCGGAVAEDSLKFDTSREIAAYLDQEGVKYAVKTDRENYDLFTLTYAPSSSKELDKIAIQVYAYEDSAVVIGADLLQPDTSNLLKLYQNLESMNDSVSFVRFMYDTDIEAIYPQVDIPYAEDAAFGNMVERYIYITSLVVDQNYDGMTALFQ